MRRLSVLAVTLCAVFTASTFVGAQQTPPAPPQAPATAAPAAGRQGGRGNPPVRSADVAADGRVTFRLRAPNAQTVAVAFGQRQMPMQKDAQGVWSVTTDPMNPDIYTYSIVVDGATINDPNTRQVQTSFGSFQSMVVVPGDKPWLPQANVPRGAITKHAFHSAIANDDREFYVYTPAGYDVKRRKAYPVLVLLHGLGDDGERWLAGGGGANNIFDNLIAQGTAVPMVVVATLGYGTSQGPAGGRLAQNILGYEQILFREVMPMVEKSYHVSDAREDRAIAGLSMGGATSLYVGLRNLDRFAWIGAFSSALLLFPPAIDLAAAQPPAPAPAGGRGAQAPQTVDPSVFAKTFPALDAKSNSKIRMLWIACGLDDNLIAQNRQFKEWLRSKNVTFTEQEVPNMAHVWPLWRQNLTDVAQLLFQGRK